MTFGVTGTKGPSSTGNGIRGLEIVMFDTEAEARDEAENWIKRNYTDVTVWKQIATPKVETIVKWEETDHG